MNHRFIRLIIGLLIVFILAGCSSKTEEKNKEELFVCLDNFYKFIEEGKTDQRLQLYADSAIIMPNYGELIYFDETARLRWKGYDEEYIFRIKDLERIKLEILGSTAYVINKYYYTFHAKTDTANWKKTKNIHIWKRLNNKWLLYADIWNSSE